MEAFTDTVGEHILGAIQVDIEQALFEDWNQSNSHTMNTMVILKEMNTAYDARI